MRQRVSNKDAHTHTLIQSFINALTHKNSCVYRKLPFNSFRLWFCIVFSLSSILFFGVEWSWIWYRVPVCVCGTFCSAIAAVVHLRNHSRKWKMKVNALSLTTAFDMENNDNDNDNSNDRTIGINELLVLLVWPNVKPVAKQSLKFAL